MACRCNDIIKCADDIFLINEIKDLFANEEVLNAFVSTELQNLATDCFSTFSCINMADLMYEEKSLNKDMTDLLPRLLKKCEDKIEELIEEKEIMKEEDHSYHEHEHDN